MLLENPLIYKNRFYQIDFEDLEKKLSQKKSKVLLLCNPHNPTGRVWSKAELRRIINLCTVYKVKIISDDIHMDITYKKNFTPITSVVDNVENMFICSSSSKTFNTPSLGGAYVLIPNEVVRKKFLKILKNRDGISSPTIFGLLSLIEGYKKADDWVDELCGYLYGNLELVKKFIESELPILKFQIPESTYLAWIDVKNLNRTSEQIQDALTNIGKVGIMPGDVYGAANGTFLRMNIGCPRKKVMLGLEKLKMSLN